MFEFSNACRVCLTESKDNFESLVIQGGTEGQLSELGRFYEDLFELTIDKNDNGPRCICQSCLLQLKLFWNFKNRAIQSYETIQELCCVKIKDENALEYDFEQETVIVDGEGYYDHNDEEYSDVVYLDEITHSSNSNEIAANVNEEPCVDGDKPEVGENYCEPVKKEPEPEIESETISCRRCNEDFVDKEELIKHRKKKHVRKRMTCPRCGRLFLSKETLNAHMKTHFGLPAYRCEECGKDFDKRDTFIVHQTRHNKDRNVQCHLCGKKFVNKTDFKIHMRVHNDERRYECNICKKRFRAYTHMTDHKYQHSGVRLKCDICSQSYSSPNTLRTHKKSMHGNVFPYCCDYCPKKFKRKHHLQIHLNSHVRKGEVVTAAKS